MNFDVQIYEEMPKRQKYLIPLYSYSVSAVYACAIGHHLLYERCHHSAVAGAVEHSLELVELVHRGIVLAKEPIALALRVATSKPATPSLAHSLLLFESVELSIYGVKELQLAITIALASHLARTSVLAPDIGIMSPILPLEGRARASGHEYAIFVEGMLNGSYILLSYERPLDRAIQFAGIDDSESVHTFTPVLLHHLRPPLFEFLFVILRDRLLPLQTATATPSHRMSGL